MKFNRAEHKAEKAIDALIDLQQDYHDELSKAEGLYETERALDLIRSVISKLSNKQ